MELEEKPQNGFLLLKSLIKKQSWYLFFKTRDLHAFILEEYHKARVEKFPSPESMIQILYLVSFNSNGRKTFVLVSDLIATLSFRILIFLNASLIFNEFQRPNRNYHLIGESFTKCAKKFQSNH